MERDLYNDVDDRVALDAADITTNTTTVGNIIDTAGYESLLYTIILGTRTDGTYTVILEEGDDSGLSDAAIVPAANLQGALPVMNVSDTVARVGSAGKKRYQRLSILSASVTTGTTAVSSTALLGHPKHAPVAQ